MSRVSSSGQWFRVYASVVVPSCVCVPRQLYERMSDRLQLAHADIFGATMALNGLGSIKKPLSRSAADRMRMSRAPLLENNNYS